MEEVMGGTNFQYSTQEIPKLIKVVGVGGGGGNAVTHMFTTGQVAGVSFLLCNTDQQALRQSAVPDKVILGEGLGAGNLPDVARQAAEASEENIKNALCDGETQMVFITAGMGGGTGTGASPVVGRIAKQAGLLVVGIVTIPFAFEGRNKILKALKGVKELEKNVDALLVVNNQKLIDLYPTEDIEEAFRHADETLTTASRGISDMVNQPARINLDFADVRTTLKDGGVAVINTGYGEGAGRVTKAIKDALHSPLFNNNNVKNAKRLLFNVYSPKNDPVSMHEFKELQDFIDSLRSDIDVIWGSVPRAEVDRVAITVLASGFDYSETDRYIRMNMDGEQARGTGAEAHGSGITEEEERLLEDFYGQGVVGSGGTKKTHPLVLTISELDNEDLLEELEQTPAIRRDSKVAENIRLRYKSLNAVGQQMPQASTGTYAGRPFSAVSGPSLAGTSLVKRSQSYSTGQGQTSIEPSLVGGEDTPDTFGEAPGTEDDVIYF